MFFELDTIFIQQVNYIYYNMGCIKKNFLKTLQVFSRSYFQENLRKDFV